MSAQNRPDDLGTFKMPFVVQKGKTLLIFNDAPTNPWTWEIASDPNSGPPAVLISGPAISNAYSFATYDIDIASVVLNPGERYLIRVKDNTLSVISEGRFTLQSIDAGAPGGLVAEINNLVSVGLGLQGENAKLINDDVRFGIPVEQTLTIYTDETLAVELETIDIRRYLDATNRVIAEVSRRRA